MEYIAPQWVDTDGNGDAADVNNNEHNYAVAYKQGSKPKIKATFSIPGLPDDSTVVLSASGTDGINIPETTAVLENGIYKFPSLIESTTAWGPSIKYYNREVDQNEFKLNWTIKIDNKDPVQFATTKHQVYVTLDDPITTARQETLFYLGCKNADGETLADFARAQIYVDFRTRIVYRIDDPFPMTYWLNGGSSDCHSFEDLLSSEDGNGSCTAWADLFTNILKVQGIEASTKVITPYPTIDRSMHVQTWSYVDPGSGPSSHPYAVDLGEAIDEDGIPGQSNGNPPGSFDNHFITESGGRLYDPSYGTPSVGGANRYEDYEDAAFSGYAKVTTIVGETFFYSARKNNIGLGVAEVQFSP